MFRLVSTLPGSTARRVSVPRAGWCARWQTTEALAGTLKAQGGNGYYKLAVPLPSRDRQIFSLPRSGEQLKTFLSDLMLEDPTITTLKAYNTRGDRIAGSVRGEDLVKAPWILDINGKRFRVESPYVTASGNVKKTEAFKQMKSYIEKKSKESVSIPLQSFFDACQDLNVSRDQALKFLEVFTQDGLAIHFPDEIELKDKIILGVEEVSKSVENALDLPYISLSQKDRLLLLAKLKKDLVPLEETYAQLSEKADRNVQILVWGLFGALSLQFFIFARLTWWDYSWDVTEPFTYFVTVAETVVAGYYWYLWTGKEYENMHLREILFNWRFRSHASRNNFELSELQNLKKKIADLEHEIQQFGSPPEE